MKKIFGIIALVVSLVLIANSKVAASTTQSTNTNSDATSLSKHDLVQIVDEHLKSNLILELAPLKVNLGQADLSIKIATNDIKPNIAISSSNSKIVAADE